jgi:hypothetical protein
MWRAEDGNDLALVAPKDAEVGFVGGKNGMARIKFAHTDETKISQVWLAVGVASCEVLKLVEVARAVKGNAQRFAVKHSQNGGARLQVERGLGENCLTGQEGQMKFARQLSGPLVVCVFTA